jgi:NAD(P)-dependent dehydrogenase (short-subunit alcohol dehydrogenase family)
LGRALAIRFVQGGFRVALVSRHDESVRAVQAEIEGLGGFSRTFLSDASSEESVRATFRQIHEEIGAPEVLLYNAAVFQLGEILDLKAASFEHAWRVNCLGGLLSAQAVLPGMLERGRGTVIFSGATASLRGSARFATVAVGKFGLRALAQSMARELGPRGIHVAHVVLDGLIDTPRVRANVGGRDPQTFLDPVAIAETYWSLYAQDARAWSQEVDLRPSVEKF